MLQTIPQPSLVLRHKQATAPQRRFWRDGARFRLFVGGVGSGKTRAGCVEILRQPDRSVGMVVAPTYPMLRDATMRTFVELAQRGKVLETFHKAEMQATLIDGKRILFRSADDPDRLRGPNLGWFYLDEAALMDADVWPIMIGRLRQSPGRAWATSTPRGFNWMYEVFANGGQDYAIVRSSTRDNVFLPSGFVGSLERSYDTQWLAQEVEGEFLDLGSIDHFLPSMELWDACKDDALPDIGPHEPCILALDGSESDDTFPLVLISRHPLDPVRFAVRKCHIWTPIPGVVLDDALIEAEIRDWCTRYAIQQIAYDRALIGQLIRRLTTQTDGGSPPIAVPVEKFNQGVDRLVADKGLYDLITQRRIAHNGDPHLRAHIANANKKKDASGHMRIVKRTHALKIDAAVATAMGALRAAELVLEMPAEAFVYPSYDTRKRR